MSHVTTIRLVTRAITCHYHLTLFTSYARRSEVYIQTYHVPSSMAFRCRC